MRKRLLSSLGVLVFPLCKLPLSPSTMFGRPSRLCLQVLLQELMAGGRKSSKALPLPALRELTADFQEVGRTRKWDESQLCVWMQFIPKVEEGRSSPLPTKQRTINLLPMLYRVWSSARCRQLVHQFSQVAPGCAEGFLRGRSCRKLWLKLKLAWHLEACIVNSRPLS